MGWVSEDTAKKNDQLAQLIVKMRSDADLLQLVKELADLTPEQRASVRSLLAAFGGTKEKTEVADLRIGDGSIEIDLVRTVAMDVDDEVDRMLRGPKRGLRRACRTPRSELLTVSERVRPKKSED